MVIRFLLLMKLKNLYFLLITVLIAVSIFNLPILSTFRAHVKYKIRVDIINKNFKNKDLIVFESSQITDAKWLEEHEFILNEEMFDVIKKEEINGKTYYHCFNDTHENKVRKVQKFVSETLNFKSVEIPEMGVPKVILHAPQNQCCEIVEAQNAILKIFKISPSKIAVTDRRFAYCYCQKFNIPPENYC